MGRDTLTGTRIRERRHAVGLKQAELAEMAGISASYLNLIEHNRRRIGGKLLLSISRVLEVEPSVLVDGAEVGLITALREAAAARPVAKAELDRIDEFAGRFPGWAALLADSRGRIDTLERMVEALTDRLTHDPHLAASLHDMISTVTAIRSTAGILSENKDIEPEWQNRFHRNIDEDARRLAETSTALVRYLDAAESDHSLTSPEEEVEQFLSAKGFHFPGIEAGEQSVDDVIEAAQELTMIASRDVARRYLERYARDAARVPLDPLMAVVGEKGCDPSAVSQICDAPMGVILHRLATLPRSAGLGELGLVICDASGTPIFRKPLDEFALPRFGAGCALWPLYGALSRPSQPLYRIIETSARESRRFETFSIAEAAGSMRFGGMVRIEATMLVRPVPTPREPATDVYPPVPVGVTCRICSRAACDARREPSVLADKI